MELFNETCKCKQKGVKELIAVLMSRRVCKLIKSSVRNSNGTARCPEYKVTQDLKQPFILSVFFYASVTCQMTHRG